MCVLCSQASQVASPHPWLRFQQEVATDESLATLVLLVVRMKYRFWDIEIAAALLEFWGRFVGVARACAMRPPRWLLLSEGLHWAGVATLTGNDKHWKTRRPGKLCDNRLSEAISSSTSLWFANWCCILVKQFLQWTLKKCFQILSLQKHYNHSTHCERRR